MPGSRALKNDSAGEKDYELYRTDVMLEGANPAAVAEASEGQEYHEQYYVPGVCADDATAYTYKRVMYRDVYPNIDWALYIKDNQLEYDFIVRPGGNVADIKLRYGGAASVAVSEGSIAAATPLGSIAEGGLYCYEQESGKPVAAEFVAESNMVRIETVDYKGTLVVDPRLQWATYCGDTETVVNAMATDTSGNLYATGSTNSVAHIATSGAYDTVYHPLENAFLAKLNSGGNIAWATYCGGNEAAGGYAATTDDSGNIYIAGNTYSTAGVATAGAHQTVYGGGRMYF